MLRILNLKMKPQQKHRTDSLPSQRFSDSLGTADLGGFSITEVFQVLWHWVRGTVSHSKKSSNVSVGFSRPRSNVEFEQRHQMTDRMGVARFKNKSRK